MYTNGFHFKSPLVKVHEMDGAVQIDTYQGDSRIAVRLGNNSTALADASIRWQIKQDAADELFVQYKTFDGVRVNLIERNLKVALNEAFASFDPLATKNLETSPLPAISKDALDLLRDKVGSEVEIIDVSVPTIDYDDKTEERINQINEERANTTKAGQEVETNKKRREAAEELAKMPPPRICAYPSPTASTRWRRRAPTSTASPSGRVWFPHCPSPTPQRDNHNRQKQRVAFRARCFLLRAHLFVG